MRFRRVSVAQGRTALAVHDDVSGRWLPIAAAAAELGNAPLGVLPTDDLVALLAGGDHTREALANLCLAARQRDIAPAYELAPLLPFRPVLMRAFATSERHWVQSARGHVRRNLPWALP
ncbi:MAG: hypothetical protein ACYDA6_09560, partial [Solirubrobacteraceae bacterium]